MQNIWNDNNLKNILKQGGVAVMPTDTLYGVVGQAENKETIKRIYKLKKRAHEKPFITLIGDWTETKKFGIDASQYKIPESALPTTYVIEGVSFRVPQILELRKLLLETGPLIAPSANPEGLEPAENIEEAQKYFSDSVDLYIDGGILAGKASRLIKLHKDGSTTILRA